MRNKALAVFSALILGATALHAQTGTATTPININTATRTQLADAGWGQYADAIIAARPYKNMNDLVEKKVVPQTAYDKGVNQFTIGSGDTPLSDPNRTSPTLTQPPVTPPSSTSPGTVPPTSTPGINPTTPPSVTPGTTSPTSPTSPSTPSSVTPPSGGAVSPSAAPAAPAK